MVALENCCEDGDVGVSWGSVSHTSACGFRHEPPQFFQGSLLTPLSPLCVGFSRSRFPLLLRLVRGSSPVPVKVSPSRYQNPKLGLMELWGRGGRRGASRRSVPPPFSPSAFRSSPKARATLSNAFHTLRSLNFYSDF